MEFYLKEAGAKGASEAARWLASTHSEDCVLNIEGARNYTPFSMLLLSEAARAFNAEREYGLQLQTDAEEAYEFAYKIGFLREAGLAEQAMQDEEFFPVTAIDIKARQSLEEAEGNYLERGETVELIAKEIALRFFDRAETGKLLRYLLRESMRNAPEHGNATTVRLCLRVDHKEGTVEFAVADEGIGIFQSLTSNPAHRSYLQSNADALRWAIKPGISVAFAPAFGQKSKDVWANSGFGLYMISTICNRLGGAFYLASGEDCLTLEKDVQEVFKCRVKGTIVGGKIPFLKEGTAQQRVDEARKEGEQQAASIKNAFKEASLPSKKV